MKSPDDHFKEDQLKDDRLKNDRRIDYVEFPALKTTAIKYFYGTVFGWQFEDYGPEYAAFSDGRLSGGFHARPEADLPSTGAPPKPLIVIYAADLEGVLSSVKNAGGKIVREIYSFPGGRRFHFADPSGNELAVWSE